MSLYTTYEDGGNVLWYQGNRSIYQLADTGGIPGVDMDGIIQGAEALAILDGIAAEVDVEAPWSLCYFHTDIRFSFSGSSGVALS